jgi:hypothetical protein
MHKRARAQARDKCGCNKGKLSKQPLHSRYELRALHGLDITGLQEYVRPTCLLPTIDELCTI